MRNVFMAAMNELANSGVFVRHQMLCHSCPQTAGTSQPAPGIYVLHALVLAFLLRRPIRLLPHYRVLPCVRPQTQNRLWEVSTAVQ